MTILTVDIYSGNPQPPFELLRERYNVRALIRKFSMQMGPDTEITEDLAAARGAGMSAIAGYHWADPIGNWAGQADWFLRMIDLHKPDGIATDIEHYWPRWPKNNADAPLPAARILENAKYLHAYIQQRCGLPELKYTARWFAISYCPQLGPWLADKATWLAHYLDVYNFWPLGQTKAKYPYPLTQAEFENHLNNKIKPMADARTFAIPTGVTNPKLWQFSSRMILEGCRSNFDLSIWLGDQMDFNAFFRLAGPPVIDWQSLLPEEKLDGPVLRLLQAHGYVTADGKVVR